MSGPRQIIFRADPELVDRIAAAAEERGISRNHLIGRLLTEGLDNLIPADQVRYTGRAAPVPPLLPPLIKAASRGGGQDG